MFNTHFVGFKVRYFTLSLNKKSIENLNNSFVNWRILFYLNTLFTPFKFKPIWVNIKIYKSILYKVKCVNKFNNLKKFYYNQA